MRVLYIKANPKNDGDSSTFNLANKFVEEYKKNHPEDEVVELDLYKENIKFLDESMLANMYKEVPNEMSLKASQFSSFDKYIFAAPMWNLSIPAILKAYFDYVTFAGITFTYTPEGPKGLLGDKHRKAIHIVSRGGMYSQDPYSSFELGDRYIRTILGFYGITDVSTLEVELMNVLQNEELQQAKDNALERAVLLAKQF